MRKRRGCLGDHLKLVCLNHGQRWVYKGIKNLWPLALGWSQLDNQLLSLWPILVTRRCERVDQWENGTAKIPGAILCWWHCAPWMCQMVAHSQDTIYGHHSSLHENGNIIILCKWHNLGVTCDPFRLTSMT